MAETSSVNWFVRQKRAIFRNVKVVFDWIGEGNGLRPDATLCALGTAEAMTGQSHRPHRVTQLFNARRETVAGECDCEDFFKTASWAPIAQPRHPRTGARMCYHMIAAEMELQSRKA